MKLITLFLLVGMFAVSGWAQEAEPEPYSLELVKRAEAGDAKAQSILGACYYYGSGVKQDYKEAVKLYKKSAEQGDAVGQSALALLYANGEGVIQDYKEAVKWYTKAAEQGNGWAKKELEKLKSK
jgi:hypothetical protein